MRLYCFLLYYLLITTTTSKQIEIKCPEHCKCDFFENLKRATCTNRTLVRIESNFPPETEILDLSYNAIKNLDDHVFENEKLLSLKLLNISHNNIDQIHMSAFQSSNLLKTLDLSYNRIQYILENWFWDLDSLQELYLKGNSFSRLDTGPIFTSITLRILDLSDCHISFIGKDTFSNIPNLDILDISNNYLINFYVAAIKRLPNLRILNLNNMQQFCGGDFKKLRNYCIQNGIKFIHICNQTKKVDTEKFQRIVNSVSPDNEKNSWIYDDEEEIKTENETKTSCNNTQIDKSLLQEIVDLSPLLSILIPFIYGIAVGILIAYLTHTCTDKENDNLNDSTYLSFGSGSTHLQRKRNRFSRISATLGRRSSIEDQQHLPLREWSISESTPVLFRKNQERL